MPHAKITHLDPEVIDWKSGDISLTEIWLIARKSGASQQSPGDIFNVGAVLIFRAGCVMRTTCMRDGGGNIRIGGTENLSYL